MSPPVRLATAGWVVDLEPDRGGSISQITHQPTGIPLLFRSPWPAAAATPVFALGQRDWLARYGGGWQTVAPNGGDECVVEGVTHGWHGEASVAPWTVTNAQDDRFEMRLQLRTAPLTLGRQVTLHDSRLQVTETVHNNGNSPTALMWAHHAAFHSQHGGASPVIRTNAALAVPDQRAASRGIAAAELLSSLTSGPQPSRGYPVPDPSAGLFYLGGFPPSGWASLHWVDVPLLLCLVWDTNVLPHMWLWIDNGGTHTAPWRGAARVVGLEPATTVPAHGLAAARPDNLLWLTPGEAATSNLTLHLAQTEHAVRAATHNRLKLGEEKYT